MGAGVCEIRVGGRKGRPTPVAPNPAPSAHRACPPDPATSPARVTRPPCLPAKPGHRARSPPHAPPIPSPDPPLPTRRSAATVRASTASAGPGPGRSAPPSAACRAATPTGSRSDARTRRNWPASSMAAASECRRLSVASVPNATTATPSAGKCKACERKRGVGRGGLGAEPADVPARRPPEAGPPPAPARRQPDRAARLDHDGRRHRVPGGVHGKVGRGRDVHNVHRVGRVLGQAGLGVGRGWGGMGGRAWAWGGRGGRGRQWPPHPSWQSCKDESTLGDAMLGRAGALPPRGGGGGVCEAVRGAVPACAGPADEEGPRQGQV